MTDVTLPDGTIVTDVPDTPEGRAGLTAAWNKKIQTTQPPASSYGPPGPPPDDRPDWAQKMFPLSQEQTRYNNESWVNNQNAAAKAAAQERVDAIPPPAPPAPGPDTPLSQRLLHYAGLGGSAALRGVLRLPALAADAGLSLDPGRYPAQPGEANSQVSTIGQQPATQGERYAANVVEGMSGGATSVPGKLVSAARVLPALSGGTAALGGDVAAQLSPPDPTVQLLARVLGSVAGGGTTGLGARAVRTTRADLVREATNNVDPKDLEAARMRMASMLSSGYDVNASQAMDVPSNIDSMVARLANSPKGENVQAQLNAQPGTVAAGADSLTKRLPGEITMPREAANTVQQAATDAIDAQVKQRTQIWNTLLKAATPKPTVEQQNELAQASSAWDKAYPGVDPTSVTAKQLKYGTQPLLDRVLAARSENGFLNPDDVRAEVSRLRDLASNSPNTELQGALNTLAGKMTVGKGGVITDPLDLNRALTDFSGQLKRPSLGMPGAAAHTVSTVDSQIAQIRNNLGEKFAPIKAANKGFQDFTTNTLDPMEQGPTGSAAGVSGYDPAKNAVQSRILGLFDKGTPPGSKTSDILTLEKQIRGSDPTAFPTAFKTWIAGKVAASKAGPGLGTPTTMPEAVNKFMGTAGTAENQGFTDSLVGLARSQGLPDSTLTSGAKAFREFVTMASKRPDKVGDAQEALKTTAAGASQEALRAGLNQILFGIRRAVSNFRAGDAEQYMDKLLTSPEGMDTLIKLSKSPVMGRTAVTAMGTFFGVLPQGDAAKDSQ